MNHRRLVVISDFQDGPSEASPLPHPDLRRQQWLAGAHPAAFCGSRDNVVVEGSYIERLPLACLKAGLIDAIEVWTHWRGSEPPPAHTSHGGCITHRSFRLDGPEPPFESSDMLAYIAAFGAPSILCVWGLGVSEAILAACGTSTKIYNSIDAPALRAPPSVIRHFDIVLTGAQWQSDIVHGAHPHIKTLILPIGPEFAADTMFYPCDEAKRYDLIYVAAAQPYKRHDILFDAMAALPRSIRALCVIGYGELSEALRARASALAIDVDFVGPPGVPYPEVNRLMNRARIGVVCGKDDGAPAILTEYMLAGLPVLANDALVCGLQYITPLTGRTAAADKFADTILEMLANLGDFAPREQVLAHWTWPHSVVKLAVLLPSG
jgi:glycosyltransferase involved in cell wall biosynthesis